jgi:transposase
MTVTTIAHIDAPLVTVGVDTHLDVHVAVALDHLGRRLGTVEVASNQAGYDELVEWAGSWGEIETFGIEGTGCYGAGLTRMLRSHGYRVVEVIRPNRQTRRHKGKSDAVDAEAAARAVLAGEAAGTPKAGDHRAEMIRVLRVERHSAVKARTQAVNTLRGLVVTAPAELRDQLRNLPAAKLIATAAQLRPDPHASVLHATTRTLRGLARRCQHLDQELAELDAELDVLVPLAAPKLVELFGFGTDTAGQLIVTAGDNPERLRSEAAFSMLCGSSPLPASSGKTQRHRLNRGGDRQANAALYRVALVRMRWHQPTRDYVERRTKEGKSKLEIIRCLKRYIAREAYTALTAQHHQTNETPA